MKILGGDGSQPGLLGQAGASPPVSRQRTYAQAFQRTVRAQG